MECGEILFCHFKRAGVGVREDYRMRSSGVLKVGMRKCSVGMIDSVADIGVERASCTH